MGSSRIIPWAVTAVALVLGSGPLAAQTLHKWRHGIIEPKSDAGFVLMAMKRDFAKQMGLDIEVLPVKSDALGLRALLSGDLDSYEGAPGDALISATKGADLKIVGCSWPELVHGIFVRADVKDIADLKGKTFAISAPGAMPDLLARAAFAQHGLKDNDVQLANVGGDTDRYKALVTGVVQGAVVSTEYLPLVDPKVKLFAYARDIVPQFIRGCYMTATKTIAAKRDDMVRFLAAEIAASRYAVSHKDDTLALTREVTGAKADDPRPGFIFDEAVSHKDFDPEAAIPIDKLAWLQDLLVKTNAITKPIDVKTIVDDSVRQSALQQLAK